MFYIGVMHYFATGEGVTLYVVSGNEDSIKEAIPEYFHRVLVILTPSDWLKAADGDCVDEYQKYKAEVLKAHLPLLWKQIEEMASGREFNLEFFMKYHFNYA